MRSNQQTATRQAHAILIGFACVVAIACGPEGDGNGGSPCVVHDDCLNSPEAQDQGRCGPAAACVDGSCTAWCPDICTVVRADLNPCEPGWVCAETANGEFQTPTCRATAINCESDAHCPSYRPDLEHEWTCDDGICRFPGFHYVYEE